MKRTSFPLAAVAALLMASAAHAGQPADAARFSIMAPVQAAYDAYQATASRTQNTMDSIVIFRRRLHQLIGRNGCCAASS